MGTRAIIQVEGVNYTQLYKHWDGNPECTLPWLEKFNKEFSKARGDDPAYRMAQLVRSSVSMGEEFHLDESACTGWGLMAFGSDCGQDFTYILHANGKVTIK